MLRAVLFLVALVLCLTGPPAHAGEIHDAAGAGDLTRVQALAADPTLIDAPDDGGSTPLDQAALGGHLETARWLIDHGADVGRTDYGGVTPLHYAALGGSVELAGILVEKGSPLDLADAYGNTPLIYAAYGGHPEIVKLLHERGADLHHVSLTGQIALHFAARNGSTDLVTYMVDHGAEVARKDVYGRQSYFLARANGHEEIAEYLLAHGARDDFQIGAPRLERLAPAVTVVTVPYVNRTNAMVVAGPEGLLFVDTGMTASGPALAEVATGLADGGVRYIINTHLHADHNGANHGVDSTAAVIALPELERLAEEGVLTPSEEGMRGPSGKAFAPHYTMRFAGLDVRIIPAPGTHSDADLIVYVPEAAVACLGSILLSEGFPGVGAGSIDQYLEILDTVLDVFPPDTRFVPGHGRILDRRGLEDYRAMVAATVEAVRARMERGDAMDEITGSDVLAPWLRYEQCPFLPYTTARIWTETIYRTYAEAK